MATENVIRNPIPEALPVDVPVVAGLVLSELEARTGPGYSNDLPVPFYRMSHNRLPASRCNGYSVVY